MNLTVEQIEAEGWKLLEDKSPFTGRKFRLVKEYEVGFNEPHVLTLEFNGVNCYPELTIRHKWESSWNRFNEYIYYGTCKDLETFKLLCDLLRIKK